MLGGLLCLILFILFEDSVGIDCYVCSSFGGKDPLCEDPFDPIRHPPAISTANPVGPANVNANANLHRNGSYIYLQRNCYGARKSRLTAFPATACLKLAGNFTDDGESMVVRSCALDGGSLTSDTEIVRQNHCGGFFFGERYVRGCLEACFTDGCNSGSLLHLNSVVLILLLLCLFHCCFRGN